MWGTALMAMGSAIFYAFVIGLLIGSSSILLFIFFSGRYRATQAAHVPDTANRMTQVLEERIVEIEDEKTRASAILEHMAEGVIAVDSAKRVLILNPAAEAIFGVEKSSACGKSMIEVVRNPAIDRMMDQAMSKRTAVTEEIELHHPAPRILKANAVGMLKSKGTVSGILVLYDVTEVRKLEQLRREFVANVSHELKTPLTSIQGFIETLLAGALRDPEQAKTFLKMMEEDAGRLTRLIRDLLELSQIESKEVVLKLEPLDLNEELNKVIVGFDPRLREKNITVKNQLLDHHVHQVLADRDRLKQVLINLLDNAIKFNNEGGQILIQAEWANGRVKVSIEDTGIGIPDEIVPRIFERFFRADKARSRESGGTGLGLAIVKHLVEAGGGQVWCESKLGKGSKFFFTLPLVHS